MKSGMERIGRSVSVQSAQRSCLDKKRYPSRNHARDAASRNQKLFGETAARFWYACTLCGGFHLTSKDPELRARSRMSSRSWG